MKNRAAGRFGVLRGNSAKQKSFAHPARAIKQYDFVLSDVRQQMGIDGSFYQIHSFKFVLKIANLVIQLTVLMLIRYFD